ncbi:glycosyltransferase family 39 protein [Clostridium guangxiense]|uniref:glycosyltransferase family 39 protein n=1 Tax=Clostridium guangxiense TaxID=1662055 RepID=UPI001E4E5EDB|nr:glycosyltransferase family 39 protein [Clostridium guangxiense]
MEKIKFTKERIAITLILILSAVLNFVNIGIEGYGNSYYAAGVKSMTMSLKNFFFVAFDPTGYVTIDKPPLGFWLQAISAKIFGFSGWSILLPQAVAGVVSVWVLYRIVKRSFGSPAALISALCLSITPVFVAVSRNNTIDNTLVMTLLFACWALSIAAEKGKMKYIIISLALVGVGFNIKMLEAYMVIPAIYIVYLLCSTVSFKKRIVHLFIGTLVLVLVSFSWATVVDLVPASSRPYVGSSTNNSEIELIIGHNGVERLSSSASGMGGGGGMPNSARGERSSGMSGGKFNGKQGQLSNGQASGASSGTQGQSPSGQPGQGPNGNQGQMSGNQSSSSSSKSASGSSSKGMNGAPQGFNGEMPSGARNGSQNGGGGGFGGSSGLTGTFGGQTTAGLQRLFSKNILSDQIMWFLPIAFIGFIVAAFKEKLKIKLDNSKKASIVMWFMWLFPEFIYFSFTKGLFHNYYLTMMAAPAAALTGIGICSMWKLYNEVGWKRWILPAALMINSAAQALELSYFTSSLSTTVKVIAEASIVLTFVFSIGLCVLRLIKNQSIQLKKGAAALAFIGILIIPFMGSAATLKYAVSNNMPAAGLELLMNTSSSNGGNKQMGGMGQGKEGNSSSNSKLVTFLKKNITDEKYALVVSSSQSADSLIINNNLKVMTLGGFSGSDKTITLAQFKELVKKGEVRYVLSGGMGGSSNNEIMQWVQKNGKVVSSSEWSNSTSNSSSGRMQGMGGSSSEQLYDLKGVVK